MNAVRVMQARFASSCGVCGGRIVKGAEIRYVKGSPANHETCGDPVVGGCDDYESRSKNQYAFSRSYRRMVSSGGGYVRCTHEDYPCCGCGQ